MGIVKLAIENTLTVKNMLFCVIGLVTKKGEGYYLNWYITERRLLQKTPIAPKW